jgi:hypothetical protein
MVQAGQQVRKPPESTRSQALCSPGCSLLPHRPKRLPALAVFFLADFWRGQDLFP